jgi:zinc protease
VWPADRAGAATFVPEQCMTLRAALFLSLCAAAPLAAQADLPISDTTLANGLQVIVIENHAVPLVTVELNVRNGAYTQTPEYEGLAHLYEHMFFKANRSIPSQEEYVQRLQQLGAQWNGTTSEEAVNYFVTVGVDSLRPSMQFMEDAVRYPLFEQQELVRERPVVIGEFDRNEANPGFHLARAIDTLLWTPGYYSRKNTIGDRGIILSTPREKMQTIQGLYYVPNNTALILAGDITPRRGFQLAREIFGDWPRGADPFATPVPNPPPLAASRGVVVQQPVNGVTLRLAWQGPSVTTDPQATYVADVLGNVLSNPGSAFQKRLVANGLTFGAGMSYYTQAHIGPIGVFAQVTPEKLLEAERAILTEVGHLADTTYITQDELARAQRQLGIDALYEREQTSAWAHTVGFWWSVAGLDYYRTYVPNMQKVTRADIARYARQYLVGKPYVAGVLISPAAAAQIGLTADKLVQGEVRP